MLNFGQIRERYEEIVGETTSAAYLASVIDEAQAEIAKRFGKREKKNYYPTKKDSVHDLPENCLMVNEVRDSQDQLCLDYRVDRGMQISFPGKGHYKLYYTPVPEPIDYMDNGSKPDVHSIFHNDIVLYCVARYWQDNAEGIQGEEQKAQMMMDQFNARVDHSAKILRRNFHEDQVIEFEVWG